MRLDRRNGIIIRRTMTGLLLVLCAVATAWGQGSVPQSPTEKRATATFAGGCFWCVEADFDKVEGVLSTTSGYTAGHLANPTYSQVSAGGTGHTEVVQIVYDPAKVTYQKLLDVFWRNHDPLTRNRQFYHDAEQKRLAEASKAAAQGRLKQPVVTEITAAATFYPAEDYHQDYYLKNPVRYKFYRFNCGRDKRLEEIWGKAGITSR